MTNQTTKTMGISFGTKVTAVFKLSYSYSDGAIIHESNTLSFEFNDTLNPIAYFIISNTPAGSTTIYDISKSSDNDLKLFFSFINYECFVQYMIRRDLLVECTVTETIAPAKKSKLQSRIEQMRRDLGLDPIE